MAFKQESIIDVIKSNLWHHYGPNYRKVFMYRNWL